MKQFYHSLLLIFIFPFVLHAQIGPVEIIDNSPQAVGISKIVSADLDQNGYNDIIASISGSAGKLGYYLNTNGSDFSAFQLIDNVSVSEGVATGDFNNDGWTDLVLIGGANFEVFIYLNNNGSFSTGTLIDSSNPTMLNDVAVADFDGNGSDDLVIIAQHSIDFYRNDGTGSFTKENILSTSTSPKVLECHDLATADFNADGQLDLVVGETAGLVIYLNSGTGVFTPHYPSIMSEIGFLVHPFDIDQDGDMDVFMQTSIGERKWFSNNGNATMTYETNSSIAPDLHSFKSIDYNNDGQEDIFASYLNNVAVFLNDATHTFATEVSLVQDNNLYMDELALIDIDDNGVKDYVWSGTNSTLAYQLNTNNMTIHETHTPAFMIYPNPTEGIIFMDTDWGGTSSLKIYSLSGEMVFQAEKTVSNKPVDLSLLAAGIYLMELKNEAQTQVEKLVVK